VKIPQLGARRRISRIAVSSFGRFAGFGLVHRSSFPIYIAA
jgi:hypothetical protein